MIGRVFRLLFGCRHRRITRPITPTRRPGTPPGSTYVACLDCGNRFHYDVQKMKMGSQMPRAELESDRVASR